MTPQLRFPEFNDEWQVKRLGDIVRFGRGGALSKDELDGGGKYSAIHYGQLFTEYNEIISKVVSKTNVNTGKTSEVGDILMPTSDVTPQGLARASVINENGVMLGGDINVLKPNSFMSSSFMSYMINSQKKKIMRLVSGTTVRHVYASEVSKALYRFPSKPEQEKIADFFTAVDARIAVSEKKLELLETYKRGVMQKIFSQQIRFKNDNGKPYPDWKEKKLGELCKTAKSGGTPTATNRKYYNGGEIPFLAISDITEQGKFLTKTSKFITEEGLKNSASWVVPDNSIIYSMYASVGLPAINKIPIATSQAVINLIPNDKATTEFLYYFLLNYKRFVHRFVETGTQGNLNAQTVKNIPISSPSVEEQQKIADFLTTLDEKITAEKSKLTATRQFKKALLQRMFVC